MLQKMTDEEIDKLAEHKFGFNSATESYKAWKEGENLNNAQNPKLGISDVLRNFYDYHWKRTDVVEKFYDYHWKNPIKIA